MLLRNSILLETSLTIYLIFACNGSQLNQSGTRVAETGKNTSCGSTLNVLNCYKKAVPFSRTRAIEVISRYVPGAECDIKNLFFEWALSFENETVCNSSEYCDGNDIFMGSHTIGSGNYRIVSKIAEYDDDGFENMLSDECISTIITEKPLPMIAVGGKIAISSGKLLSAEDVNISSKQIGSLVYELTYDVIGRHPSGFRKRPLENDTFSTVPEVNSLDGLMYYFKLAIKTEESNIRQSKSDLIRVKRQSSYTIYSSSCGIANPEILDENSSDHFFVCQQPSIPNDSLKEVPTFNNHNSLNAVEKLKKWAVENKVTLSAINQLLAILVEAKPDDFHGLPRDARTFLATPKLTITREVDPGEYYHFGIQKSLEDLFKKNCRKPTDPIQIGINIDGLPIAKSSNSQFYPILGLESKNVFLIGLYHGYEKPKNFNQFLSDFVEEAIQLNNNGVEIFGHIYNFKITKFLFDAVAKASILAIKGHAGYSSCTKCSQHGESIQDRVCFPLLTFEKRTHESFVQQTDACHHSGHSILLDIPNIDIIADVPLDYMHLVLLGVVKKLLCGLWCYGPPPHKFPTCSKASKCCVTSEISEPEYLSDKRRPKKKLNSSEEDSSSDLDIPVPKARKGNTTNGLYKHVHKSNQASSSDPGVLLEIPKKVLDDKFAAEYSLVGHKHKKVFKSLKICSCILEAIQRCNKEATLKEIEIVVSAYLAKSNDRLKRQQDIQVETEETA
ncbi:hypothetical protein JTB14_005110 [Gonioctena quinquepunctata]|nr:hypothetical protein JTB14_005110 [Gonioctena quinquepunctata]